MQRALVESDPCWQRGDYADGHGPALGLGLARAMGTIFYRSREEFDARFAGRPQLPFAATAASSVIGSDNTASANASAPSPGVASASASASAKAMRLTPLASLPSCQGDMARKMMLNASRASFTAVATAPATASAASSLPRSSTDASASANGNPPSSAAADDDDDNWPATIAAPVEFDVEAYLAHAARKFPALYDANCWLLLSRCLDLQDMGRGFGALEAPAAAAAAATSASATASASASASASSSSSSISATSSAGPSPLPSIGPGAHHRASDLRAAVARLAAHGCELLLLPVEQDALIPAAESGALAAVCAAAGVRCHHERLSSVYGHDAFLKEDRMFNARLAPFLDPRAASGVDSVRAALASASATGTDVSSGHAAASPRPL